VIEGDVDIEIIRLMLAHAGISANPVGIGTKARSTRAILCDRMRCRSARQRLPAIVTLAEARALMNMPSHASNAINYGLGRQRRDEHIEIALGIQALSDRRNGCRPLVEPSVGSFDI